MASELLARLPKHWLALSSPLPPRRDANVTHNSTIHHTMAHAGTCTRAILTFHALALTFRSCARARHDEMLSLYLYLTPSHSLELADLSRMRQR